MHFIFYTDKIIPTRFAAYTIGFLVFIRPKYRNETGLREHEMVHVKQFWRNPFFGLWYAFSDKHRLKYEVEAFREQMKYYLDDMSDTFAVLLSRNYNIDITVADAKKLLTDE